MRTLIVGAGRGGRALARELCQNKNLRGNEDHGLRPVGFVDDAPAETPLPLLGALAEVAPLVTEHQADAVVLAIPGLAAERTRHLVRAAVGAGAVVRYLPWYTATLCRDAAASDLRPLDIRALIDGPDPYVPSPEVKEIITGKRILVTGADGSLGAEICRQLAAFDPDELFPVRDIGDRDQTDRTFRELKPEIVFHSTGSRQASILERRPSLGVTANVATTDNLVRAAVRHKTERFVLISADADPASMLGATHRLAEAVVQNAARKTGEHRTDTVFAAVRVGDVLDARGSLLTVLPDQIRAGGPVTITHPDATRCFATVEEAVGLALEAGRLATGGEVYALDLGEPMRVADVVSRFTKQYKLPEVPIRYVGLPQGKSKHPGERIPTTHPQIFTTVATADHADHERLPERLDRLYKAADKNRDPKVRQMLMKPASANLARRPDSERASGA